MNRTNIIRQIDFIPRCIINSEIGGLGQLSFRVTCTRAVALTFVIILILISLNLQPVGSIVLAKLRIKHRSPANQKNKHQHKYNYIFPLTHNSSLSEKTQKPSEHSRCHQNTDRNKQTAADDVDDLVVFLDPVEC